MKARRQSKQDRKRRWKVKARGEEVKLSMRNRRLSSFKARSTSWNARSLLLILSSACLRASFESILLIHRGMQTGYSDAVPAFRQP